MASDEMTEKMSQRIPLEFLDFLIAIGEGGCLDDCLEIPDRFPGLRSGQVMRLSFSDWYEVADALDTGRLVALVKALTVAERTVPGFKAGSVSPVIWLFRRLEARKFEGLAELGDWILSNTENEYLPFGSYNYGAKSTLELRTRQAVAAQDKLDRREAESARQTQDAKAKALKAAQKMEGALRRKDAKAVEALLSQGANVDTIMESGMTIRQAVAAMGWGHLLAGGRHLPEEDNN